MEKSAASSATNGSNVSYVPNVSNMPNVSNVPSVSNVVSDTNNSSGYNSIPITRVRGVNSSRSARGNSVVVREVRMIPASEAIHLPWPLEVSPTVRGQAPVAETTGRDLVARSELLEVEEAPTITVDAEEAVTADADAGEIARIAAEIEESARIAVEIAEAERLFAEVEKMDVDAYDFSPTSAHDQRKIKQQLQSKKKEQQRQQKIKEQQMQNRIKEQQRQQKIKEQQLERKIRDAKREVAKMEKELDRLRKKNEATEKRRAKAAKKRAEFCTKMIMKEVRSLPREFRGIEPAPSSSESSTISDTSSSSGGSEIRSINELFDQPSTSRDSRGGFWLIENDNQPNTIPEHLDAIVATLSDEELALNMQPRTRFEQLMMEQLTSLNDEDKDKTQTDDFNKN